MNMWSLFYNDLKCTFVESKESVTIPMVAYQVIRLMASYRSDVFDSEYACFQRLHKMHTWNKESYSYSCYHVGILIGCISFCLSRNKDADDEYVEDTFPLTRRNRRIRDAFIHAYWFFNNEYFTGGETFTDRLDTWMGEFANIEQYEESFDQLSYSMLQLVKSGAVDRHPMSITAKNNTAKNKTTANATYDQVYHDPTYNETVSSDDNGPYNNPYDDLYNDPYNMHVDDDVMMYM